MSVRTWLAAEAFLLALFSTALAVIVWASVVGLAGLSPTTALTAIIEGSFGTGFALTQTLKAAAPLLLTGLCVAIPLQAGLVVIGGEGAIIIGGLAGAVAGAMLPASIAFPGLLLVSMVAGGSWLGICAWFRVYRGLNEAISSLLLVYLAIAVLNHLIEGPLRDSSSLDKPATALIAETAKLEPFMGLFSWSLPIGLLLCVIVAIVISQTKLGLQLRYVGGNPLAAAHAKLPLGTLAIGATFIAGAVAGLVGGFDVSGVQGRANNSLITGYGYTGILVCFLARGNIWALIPSALLVGAIEAGGGLLQRRLGAPESSAMMLHGFIFLSLVTNEALRGKLAFRFSKAS